MFNFFVKKKKVSLPENFRNSLPYVPKRMRPAELLSAWAGKKNPIVVYTRLNVLHDRRVISEWVIFFLKCLPLPSLRSAVLFANCWRPIQRTCTTQTGTRVQIKPVCIVGNVNLSCVRTCLSLNSQINAWSCILWYRTVKKPRGLTFTRNFFRLVYYGSWKKIVF